MSDVCHCAEPAPERHEIGHLYCLNCRLWFDERARQTDPRVKAARTDRAFTAKQQSLIDSIMKEGEKRDE